MSHTKRTAAEIAVQIQKAQARIDTLKKKEREATKAEAAREREELIKAVYEWVDTVPRFANGYSNSELIKLFNEWADANRRKAEQVQGATLGDPVDKHSLSSGLVNEI